MNFFFVAVKYSETVVLSPVNGQSHKTINITYLMMHL